MIDQLPTAVPQTVQSANSANRDRKQTSADKDDQGSSFEDIVSKTGQEQNRQDKNENETVDLSSRAESKERSADTRPKVALELSAALRGFATPTQVQTLSQTQVQAQSQVQAQAKSTVKDAAKAAGRVDQTAQPVQQTDEALAKLVEKVKSAAQQAEQIAQRTQQASGEAEADAEQSLTPSDELGLLLGLTKDVNTTRGRKSEDAAAIDGNDEDDEDASVDNLSAKADTPRADQVAAALDARLSSNNSALDDKSSQGDVVRLVSANGRGRPVDIEVSAASGDGQHDAAKTATTPKIDTATVLEARRYLGFTPEPNATALATAIKADPTWAEALQSAQGSDLSTLGNTVTEVNTLKLQMNPENLGNMVATLKLKGEELTVELRVDSVEAYQQLSADHDDIVKSLQDQGFTIDKVTVQLNATDRTDTGADRDTARQEQAQGDQQAQQRDGRGGQSSRNDGEREQPLWTSSGTLSDVAAGDGRTDAGDSGNIYI